MKDLIQDLLASMNSAMSNIQQDAYHKGFKGDLNNASDVLSFLANYPMDQESYALLYANSAVIDDCNMHVQRYGTDADKALASERKAFDYNA